MTPLPGKLEAAILVDNGVAELAGRVIYMDAGANGVTQRAVPGVAIDLLDVDGQPVASIPGVATNAHGRFAMSGLAIGTSYFVRGRLTDAKGQARTLYAYVRPEGHYTCVELSLASTIVAQKIIQKPADAPFYDAKKIDELTQAVKRELLNVLKPGPGPVASPGPVPVMPPPGVAVPPRPPSLAIVPHPGGTAPVWVPAPGGGGFWWSPGTGGEGGSWWDPGSGTWFSPTDGGGACGCHWVQPPGGGTGYWFRPTPGGGGAWWISGPGGTGGYWEDIQAIGGGASGAGGASSGGAGVPARNGSGTNWIWVPLPGGGGTWWDPSSGGSGSWWLNGGAGGGSWWRAPANVNLPSPSGPGGGPCGCHYIQLPGSSVGYWFAPEPVRGGGSWWMPDGTGGGRWVSLRELIYLGGGAPAPNPTYGSSGGTTPVPPGATGDTIYVLVPGGNGGYWYRPSADGNGAWWISQGGGSGGYWYVPPTVGAGTPNVPPPPGGWGGCGCHYVQLPGTSVGYWFMPSPNGGGSWWTVNGSGGGSWTNVTILERITVIGGGVAATPPPPPSDAGTGPALPPSSLPGGVYWITLPGGGGGGYYWLPGGNGGGSWWIAPVNGQPGYWVTPTPGPNGLYWVGGTWWYVSPTGHGCCCWVPLPGGGGYWVWIYPDGTTGVGAPPTMGPGALPGTSSDWLIVIDKLLTLPTLTSDPASVFDRLAGQSPALADQVQQAVDTYLLVNVVIRRAFAGENLAPFPRKADPRLLMTREIELKCPLLNDHVGGIAYALNGEQICSSTEASDEWVAHYDTRKIADGDYFLSAHELTPDGKLGRMLAKAYTHVRNQTVDDVPCEDQWNDGL